MSGGVGGSGSPNPGLGVGAGLGGGGFSSGGGSSLASRLRSLYRDPASAFRLATAPTFTLGSQGVGLQLASAIPGGILSPALDLNGEETLTPFRYLGGYDLAFGPSGVDTTQIRPRNLHGSSLANGPYSVRFGFSGDTQFGIRFKALTDLSYRLRIDDQWVTEGEALLAGTAGSIYELKVSALDSGPHVYQLDFPGNFWFGGIYSTPQGSLFKTRPAPIRAVLLSDSTGGGAGGPGSNGATGIAVWWARLCDLMGWESFNASIGGTGILDPGAAVNFAGRVTSDITSVSPDVIVVSGSRNDNIFGGSEVQAAAIELYDQIRSENSQALILALGPWVGTSRSAGYLAADAAMQAAALQSGIPYASLYTGIVYNGLGEVLISGQQWVTGTGNVSSLVGSSRHTYQTFDNGQPNGTVISVANSASGTHSDAVVSVSGSPTYDSTHAHSGSQSMATGIAGQSQITYGTPYTTAYHRFYLWISANPSSDTKIFQSDGDVTPNLHRIVLASSGKLYINLNGGGNVLTTSALPLGQWVRVEYKSVVDGATATAELKYFTSPESGTPTQTITQTGSFSDTVLVRNVIGTAVAMPNGGIWIDDYQVNNVAYPGATPDVYIKAGNADWVMGPDGTHPSLAGHTYWARQAAAVLRAMIDPL